MDFFFFFFKIFHLKLALLTETIKRGVNRLDFEIQKLCISPLKL